MSAEEKKYRFLLIQPFHVANGSGLTYPVDRPTRRATF